MTAPIQPLIRHGLRSTPGRRALVIVLSLLDFFLPLGGFILSKHPALSVYPLALFWGGICLEIAKVSLGASTGIALYHILD